MSRGETEITDVPLQGQERDAGHGDPRNRDGTENSRAEPEQSRTAAERAESATEQPPDSDRASLGKSDHSRTDDVSTNENCRLIPQHTSTPNHTLRAEAGGRENPAADRQRDHAPPAGLANGASPICTPPAAAGGRPGWRLPQPPPCNGKVCRDKKRLPSNASSGQKSLKTTASQIQQVAGDDLCASLVLACLFCRLWECLAAAGEGCWACGACVCASARGALPCCCCCCCCCEPALLEPLPADSPLCCCCGGCTGLAPDCSVCDLCLQATECLELAMEISQLLFH